MFTEKDSIISPVITFASTLVVLFSVMCPGELIILKETKAILFPVSQDANLFWLVILLWGRTAAALGIKARSNTARPPCLCMCTSGFKLTKKKTSPKTFKCCLGGVSVNQSTNDLAKLQATFWAADIFGRGTFVGCLTSYSRPMLVITHSLHDLGVGPNLDLRETILFIVEIIYG